MAEVIDPKRKEDVTSKERKEVKIKLIVDARKLYELNYPPSMEEIYEHSRLTDSLGNSASDIALECFTTKVRLGEPVEWKGVTKSDDDEFRVEIDSIIYAHEKEDKLSSLKNVNFFPTIALCAGEKGIVKARVKKETTKEESVYLYWINFRIFKGKEQYRNYSIDPRLKIHK